MRAHMQALLLGAVCDHSADPSATAGAGLFNSSVNGMDASRRGPDVLDPTHSSGVVIMPVHHHFVHDTYVFILCDSRTDAQVRHGAISEVAQ